MNAAELGAKMAEGVDVPQVRLLPIDALQPYDRNARTHSPAQVEQLQALLCEFGWTNPVLVDGAGIVAGHGRCMAARELYAAGKQIKFPGGEPIPVGYVPTLDCSGWTDEQRRAYILADNRSALSAGWDDELLALELGELADAGYDLALTAFDEAELADILAEAPVIPEDRDPDATPEKPEDPVSVLGDVWICGNHRVMCGSSLEPGDWVKLMDGYLADAVMTDPPYNVDIGGKNESLDRADKGNRGKTGAIMNDKMSDADFYSFLRSAFEGLLAVMKPGAPIYVYHADSEGINFRTAFRDAGFKLQSVLSWKKNNFVLSRWDHHPASEPCLYGWKPGAAHKWYGGRKISTFFDLGDANPFTQLDDGRWQLQIGDEVFIVEGKAKIEALPSSIINEAKPSKSGLHPTQKPVRLLTRMLRNSARAGDVVADAFGGSGSTMIACEELGMHSRLMELDPHFVDVIVIRWQAFSGKRAVHAVTGEQFPEGGGSIDRPVPPALSDGDPDVF